MSACGSYHRRRVVRDRHGRDLGAMCLECGALVANTDDRDLLTACSVRFLLDPSVELGTGARRELERIRRRLQRSDRFGPPRTIRKPKAPS